MPIRTKIDPLGKDITVIFADVVSEPARSRYLASFAREKLTEAQEINRAALGRVPPHETFVDGRAGGNLDAVRPDGQIIFEFELLDEVFAWVGEMLIRHSPVGQAGDPRPGHPGFYQASHAFFADNAQVDPGSPVPLAQEYFFVNTAAYARKIERGLSNQAPDGVYQTVATMASSRFSNLAKVSFGYRTPLFGQVHEWAHTTRLTGKGRPMSSRTRAEWLRRQPAVIIRPR